MSYFTLSTSLTSEGLKAVYMSNNERTQRGHVQNTRQWHIFFLYLHVLTCTYAILLPTQVCCLTAAVAT